MHPVLFGKYYRQYECLVDSWNSRRSIRDRSNQPDQQREETRQHDLYPDYENSDYLMGIEDMFNISFGSFGDYDSN